MDVKITTKTHEKRGIQIWIVRPVKKLRTTALGKFKREGTAKGGRYSTFVKGTVFKFDPSGLYGNANVETEPIEQVIRAAPLSDIPEKVKLIMPAFQQGIVKGSEELMGILPDLLCMANEVPNIRAQEKLYKDAIVHLHYFYGGSDWWVTEWDGEDLFFGYGVLSGDWQNAEFGYMSRSEITGTDKVELDFYWRKKTINQILEKNKPTPVTAPDPSAGRLDDWRGTLIKARVYAIEQFSKDELDKMKHAGILDWTNKDSIVAAIDKKLGTMEKPKSATVIDDPKPSTTNEMIEVGIGAIDIDKPYTDVIDDIVGGDYKDAFEINEAIKNLLDNVPPDYDAWSTDDIAFLALYSGAGGLEKKGAEGAGLLHEFFTPEKIAYKMWGLAYKHGYGGGGSVMEPSVGPGMFFKFAPRDAELHAVELNKYSARICKILYPGVHLNIINGVEQETAYFEQLFIKNNWTIKDKLDHLPKHDLVIGNPPYMVFKSRYSGMGEEKYTHARNYVDYFILRSLDITKSRGLVILIVGAETSTGGELFLRRGSNKCKEMISQRGDLIDAYRLPDKIFERTAVSTEIIVFRKK